MIYTKLLLKHLNLLGRGENIPETFTKKVGVFIIAINQSAKVNDMEPSLVISQREPEIEHRFIMLKYKTRSIAAKAFINIIDKIESEMMGEWSYELESRLRNFRGVMPYRFLNNRQKWERSLNPK